LWPPGGDHEGAPPPLRLSGFAAILWGLAALPRYAA
jgi:hypothetical protein